MGKTTKVYEVVMPDRKLAVFGVAMNDGGTAMANGSSKSTCRTASRACPTRFTSIDNVVGAPHGRFRIALAFPDVGMGQFMRISSLPNAIIETMGAVAGAEKKSSGESWQ